MLWFGWARNGPGFGNPVPELSLRELKGPEQGRGKGRGQFGRLRHSDGAPAHPSLTAC